MKNRLLKYCFIMISLLIALQSFSAGTFSEKVYKNLSIDGTSLSVKSLQSDLDDSPVISGAIFQTTILHKHFFYSACYLCKGIIPNPGLQTLSNWVKVKLQV